MQNTAESVLSLVPSLLYGEDTNKNTPIMAIITSSLNTGMYATIVLVIMHKYVNVSTLYKLGASSLTLPQFLGYAYWMHQDEDASSRSIYLWC